MKAKTSVTLHNKFEIEVRDCRTGEIKQKAEAYNMVLDNMWTRLCGGSTYFTSIQFGTGTGTQAASRTTLFTYLGGKAAVDVEQIKAIPNSSWKRSIVLNPEEYVGSVLSEVGVAYQTSTGGLVTHAMIQDSEGTPITITKTAVDLITIYATVYVTFSVADDTKMHFISMPDGNELVNYLIGGSSAPTDYFKLGSNGAMSEDTLVDLGSYSLGSTAIATWVSDVPNKQRKTAAMRFGTTVGNGHVQEFIFDNLFRCVLPCTGVFTGQDYAGVPIGTGDGSETEFELPSLNIRQSSIVMKLDDVAETGITKTLFNSMFNFRYNLDNIIYARYMAVSSDGLVLISNKGSEPTVSDWTNCGWIKRPSASEAAFSSVSVYCLAINADGSVVAMSQGVPPYFKVYDWVVDTWVLRAAPTEAITDAVAGLSLSSDGSIVAVSYNYYVRVYDWTEGAWVLRTTISVGEYAYKAQLTPDGLVLAFSINTSPFFKVYDWVTDAWVLRADPSVAPTGTQPTGYKIRISDDGLMILVSSYTPNYYTEIYDWVTDAWVKRTQTGLLAEVNIHDASISSDKTRIALAAVSGGYVYDLIGTTWVPWAEEVPAVSEYNYACAILSDRILFGYGDDSPYLGTYDTQARQTRITFDTAPANGVAITADYTVDGIHKTDQYVIDAGLTIQFGEPA